MYFHVCKKNYPASSGQHICMILVSFKGYINKAINKGNFVKFQRCILCIQQFEILGNFEKVTFPLTSMVMLPKNCQNKYLVLFKNWYR